MIPRLAASHPAPGSKGAIPATDSSLGAGGVGLAILLLGLGGDSQTLGSLPLSHPLAPSPHEKSSVCCGGGEVRNHESLLQLASTWGISVILGSQPN